MHDFYIEEVLNQCTAGRQLCRQARHTNYKEVNRNKYGKMAKWLRYTTTILADSLPL